jgi:tRNA-2-methylthio-N6-dimethylallyladenosine synthase
LILPLFFAKVKQHLPMVKHYYHIFTFGCQMNKNDSERLESVLLHMGMEPTDDPKNADVIFMNSCSVRESAENRIFGFSANFAEMKKVKPSLIIGVTGCMPGRDKNGELRKKLPEVDLFFPTKDMIHLPTWLSSLNPELRPMDDMPADYLALRPTLNKTFQAFVTIQTGCNHFCTYCVVPYSRGLEVNRPAHDILSEIKDLAARGCVEVTLLGQIVNHYIAPDPESFRQDNPYKKNDFAKLLWEINQISGIERIHWTAPHPLYMDDEAIDSLTLPKQLNYIHLPVQAGNTDILNRMNRRHTREFYLDVIKKIREKKPDIAIGTDIIVGFCGETESQFDDTVSLYKECDFDISYHAKYSTRSHTLATKIYKDDVVKTEKKRRWQVLQDLMEDTTSRKNQLFVGKTVSVLFDRFDKGFAEGNSKEMKRVRVKGDASLLGSIREVEIFKSDTWMLWGRLV